jgi:hypothetical protein
MTENGLRCIQCNNMLDADRVLTIVVVLCNALAVSSRELRWSAEGGGGGSRPRPQASLPYIEFCNADRALSPYPLQTAGTGMRLGNNALLTTFPYTAHDDYGRIVPCGSILCPSIPISSE